MDFEVLLFHWEVGGGSGYNSSYTWSVSTVTGNGLDDWGLIPGTRFFSSLQHPDWIWGTPNLLSNRYQWLFPWGKVARV
jgi:hypothetical protein